MGIVPHHGLEVTISVFGIFAIVLMVRNWKLLRGEINHDIKLIGFCVILSVWVICVFCILLLDNYVGLSILLAIQAVLGGMVLSAIKMFKQNRDA